MPQPSDLEIARQATMLPIVTIAENIGLRDDQIESYGRWKAKVSYEALRDFSDAPKGKLILVTAISPTPAGEGKTTTCIGLADALSRSGKKTVVCLREPSLGPCFGMKGGAAGGGYSQVVPMEDINLHFTGDIHAISAAHNLLAAMVDNHLQHGNELGLDVRQPTWNRVVDLNDRALRKILVGLGGRTDGVPRESSFDIAVASEIMAVFCLAESLSDLKKRLGRIIVGYTAAGNSVTASQLKAHGAMAALLRDALKPNLVQTLEGTPAIIHGGPFANIAHGCNSVTATRLALGLSDYVVTEAGFGADLGAQKFFGIKCYQSGLWPDAVVIVATIRALKYHGGLPRDGLQVPDLEALDQGCANLRRHIENLRLYGVPLTVAVNSFPTDTDEEILHLVKKCEESGVPIARSDHWARGGEGALELARVVDVNLQNAPTPTPKTLFPDSMPLLEKIEGICRTIYGADKIRLERGVLSKVEHLERLGFGHLPVCMAKTQYSFSADPNLRGSPSGFDIPIRDLKVSAGAGFIVVLTGEIMTMPGLPKSPAAERIDVDDRGRITGLF